MPVEIAYGLERLTMFVQGVDTWCDIVWARGDDGVEFTYGDVYLENEREYSSSTSRWPTPTSLQEFADREVECLRTLKASLPLPAYDSVLSAAMPSTCSTPAASSRLPSAWPTSCACAPWPRPAAPPT